VSTFPLCHNIGPLSKAKTWPIGGKFVKKDNFPLSPFGDRSLRDSGGGTNTIPRYAGEMNMADQEQAEIRLIVARLRQEHEDYDAAINAMIETGCDALRIQRMKKKKLVIKDKLTKLEDQIIPDIIA